MLRSVIEGRRLPHRAIGLLAVLSLMAWYVAVLATRSVPAPVPLPESPPAPPVAKSMKVGVQAGHWKTYDVPDELSKLRDATGAMGSNWDEFIVNYEVAKRVVVSLQARGIEAEMLPTTIPENYQADAFVSLHGDGSTNTKASGFKAVHSTWSTNTDRDDVLVGSLVSAYGAATGLKEDRGTITDDMTDYYAFNYKDYRHSVNPDTPTALLEMGFLTNDSDRKMMLSQYDKMAQAVTDGIMNFLSWYEQKKAIGKYSQNNQFGH